MRTPEVKESIFGYSPAESRRKNVIIEKLPSFSLTRETNLDSLRSLYKKLLTRARDSFKFGSKNLFIAGYNCGFVTSGICKTLLTIPEVEIRQNSVYIASNYCPGPELDSLLSYISAILYKNNCLKAWYNELITVYTAPNRKKLGVIERAAARPLGLFTQSVHLNAWSPEGKLWVSRRSLSRAINPGKWSTLAGGLVAAGENPGSTLIRESSEEVGLDISNIASLTCTRCLLHISRRLQEGYQNEDLFLNSCVIADGLQYRQVNDEVMEIINISTARVFRLIEQEKFTLESSLVILADFIF